MNVWIVEMRLKRGDWQPWSPGRIRTRKKARRWRDERKLAHPHGHYRVRKYERRERVR